MHSLITHTLPCSLNQLIRSQHITLQHHITLTISRKFASNYSSHLHHDDMDHNDITTDISPGDTIPSLSTQLHQVRTERELYIKRSEHSVASTNGPFCSLEFALKLREKIKSYNTLEHQLIHKITILKQSSSSSSSSSNNNDNDDSNPINNQHTRSYHTTRSEPSNTFHGIHSTYRRAYTTTCRLYNQSIPTQDSVDNTIIQLRKQLDGLEQQKLSLLDHSHVRHDITASHQAEISLNLQRIQQQQIHIIQELKQMGQIIDDDTESQYRHTVNKTSHSSTIRSVELNSSVTASHTDQQSMNNINQFDSTDNHLGVQAILSFIQSQVAVEYRVYDIANKSTFHDYLFVVMANSARQMLYLANILYKQAKQYSHELSKPSVISIEGKQRSTAASDDDWTLVDLGSVMIYIFQKQKPVIQYDESNNHDDSELHTSDSTDSTIQPHEYKRHHNTDIQLSEYSDIDIDSLLSNNKSPHIKLNKRSAINRSADSPIYDQPDDIDSAGLGWNHPAILRVQQKYHSVLVPESQYNKLSDYSFEYTDRESRLKAPAIVVDQSD